MANIQNLIPAKKGEIRNPNGKPIGTRNRSTIARKWLQSHCILPDTDFYQLISLYPEVEKEMSNEDIMTIIQINKAITTKDTVAYEKLLDSAYGKPSQDININPETLDDETLAALYNQLNDNTESNE